MSRTRSFGGDGSLRPRFALMGALAFVSACVAHEAAGHGGTCLASGGKVLLLTSVYFRCAPGVAIVDADGPLMNLVVAAVAMAVVRRSPPGGERQSFAALVFAFNALWGAGYFLFSAVTDQGDWAFVLRDFHAEPLWAWRVLLGVLGAWLYGATLRVSAPYLPRGATLAWAYVAGSAVALASVTLFTGPIIPALREAAQESVLGSCGLLYLAFGRARSAPSAASLAVAPRIRWLWPLGLSLLLVFLVTLGPGFRSA